MISRRKPRLTRLGKCEGCVMVRSVRLLLFWSALIGATTGEPFLGLVWLANLPSTYCQEFLPTPVIWLSIGRRRRNPQGGCRLGLERKYFCVMVDSWLARGQEGCQSARLDDWRVPRPVFIEIINITRAIYHKSSRPNTENPSFSSHLKNHLYKLQIAASPLQRWEMRDESSYRRLNKRDNLPVRTRAGLQSHVGMDVRGLRSSLIGGVINEKLCTFVQENQENWILE